LLAHFEALTSIGLPVLLGASRKSFLGRLLADPAGEPRPSGGREDATVALTTFAALNQAWGVRVHQVWPNVDAALTAAALQAAK
jgi:dihydropteroate synthase